MNEVLFRMLQKNKNRLKGRLSFDFLNTHFFFYSIQDRQREHMSEHMSGRGMGRGVKRES